LTLAITTLPEYSSAIFSNSGETIRQGPHQGAQKSTITGTFDFKTVHSNDASITFTGSLYVIYHLVFLRTFYYNNGLSLPGDEKQGVNLLSEFH
jgi:hypothetical protein